MTQWVLGKTSCPSRSQFLHLKNGGVTEFAGLDGSETRDETEGGRGVSWLVLSWSLTIWWCCEPKVKRSSSPLSRPPAIEASVPATAAAEAQHRAAAAAASARAAAARRTAVTHPHPVVRRPHRRRPWCSGPRQSPAGRQLPACRKCRTHITSLPHVRGGGAWRRLGTCGVGQRYGAGRLLLGNRRLAVLGYRGFGCEAKSLNRNRFISEIISDSYSLDEEVPKASYWRKAWDK